MERGGPWTTTHRALDSGSFGCGWRSPSAWGASREPAVPECADGSGLCWPCYARPSCLATRRPGLAGSAPSDPKRCGQVTCFLAEWRDGDSQAVERLVPLLYDVFRELARRQLRRESVAHTLSPTALVHEAYLRLLRQHELSAVDRDGFLAIAAATMRRVLVDHARAAAPQARGPAPAGVPRRGGCGGAPPASASAPSGRCWRPSSTLTSRPARRRAVARRHEDSLASRRGIPGNLGGGGAVAGWEENGSRIGADRKEARA